MALVEPGTLVWIPDTETGQVWVKAEVTACDDRSKTVRVKTDDGSERNATLDRLLRCNQDTWKAEDGLTAVEDLSLLTHLHEPEVLQALQLRFDIDKIYTNCGPILIVVNPFKTIHGLYDEGSAKATMDPMNTTPHIYSISDRALSNLIGAVQSQVVLISGESGAGKTENMKHVLRLLTRRLAETGRQNINSDQTMKKVLSSNPLLEAFGNACTTRNDNSSRFGKFIELMFNQMSRDLRFDCADIDTYLLEKIRITELHQDERSYHIFYQACAAAEAFGADFNGLPLHYFGHASSFVYLQRSGRYELHDVDDAEMFQETQAAMAAIGLQPSEQASIVAIVAAVMHMGNITITDKGSVSLIPMDNVSFQIVCQILAVEPAMMAKALTHKLITVSQTERYESPLNASQCMSVRESLARALYSLLFDFIVHSINKSLEGRSSMVPGSKRLFVGVLDIFGFEHFETNSFEQLCINFANERLQQLFNQFVFKTEMDIYKQEGITCDFSDFPDNQDIIDMIQAKNSSILSLLDEECRVPNGSDKNFCQKLWKTFDKHKRFKIEPRKPTSFCIIHFAGTVSYDTANFMDKNLDELGELLKQALLSSSNRFVGHIMELRNQREALAQESSGKPAKAAGPGRSKLKPNTVSAEFKGQLENLMKKVASASPHFVRCIKPNPEKLPDKYNRQMVTEQLRSGGVIEALAVQRAGYPCRWLQKECWENIRIIFKLRERKEFERMNLERRVVAALAQVAKELRWPSQTSASYAIGKTRIFFKQAPFEALERRRISILNDAARCVQSCWRTARFFKIYLQVRATTCCIQAHMRRFLARKKAWNSMAPDKRRTSRLFHNYFTGDTASEASEVCHLNSQKSADLERLRALTEASEREFEEEEDDMEAAKEAVRIEEERLRLEREQEERRAADTQKRVQEASATAAAEERRRCNEELLRAERRWQEERASLERAHSAEVRKLQSEIETAKESEARSRSELTAELQRVLRESEAHKAEFERQLTLVDIRRQEAVSKVSNLEQEIRRLRDENAGLLMEHSRAVADLHAAHSVALSQAAEQQESQRLAYSKQMDELQQSLDDVHRNQREAVRSQEAEHSQRFQQEVRHLREREENQRRRHDEELASMRAKEVERQHKLQSDIAMAQRSSSDHRLEMQVLEQQMLDLKADADQHKALLMTQQEETKRMHAAQIQMLEQRHSERERTLKKEAEIAAQNRDEQVTMMRGQLDFQGRELTMTNQQEVEMIKQQWEQRERQLMQMLDQARLGQAEREKTAEVQLQLKAQQQEELYRCADAKARHLEESARRQQELYEQHVDQLTRQSQEAQESFRRQLQDAHLQNEDQVAVSMQQLATLEAQVREDAERRRTQEELERSEVAFKLSEASRLEDEHRQLEREYEILQQRLAHANAALTSRSRAMTKKLQLQPEDTTHRARPPRRASEPAISTFGDNSKLPLRVQLGPLKLAAKSLASGQLGTRRRRSISDLVEASPVVKRETAKRGTATPRSAARRLKLLRPTLQLGGKVLVGEVSPWGEIAAAAPSFSGRQADAAITVLAFSSSLPTLGYVMLAAACKSGAILVYRVRKTAIEIDGRAEDDEIVASAGPDIEKQVRFQGHAKAVTSMCFTAEGRELVTTSSDWSVRIWRVQDGHLINRFMDSSLVVCALPLPRQLGAIVMANAGAVLRLIEENGKQQKVRLDHYARALTLALDGTRLLAATSRGHVHALDVDASGMRIVGKQQVSQVALTCIVVAPSADGMPPLLAANSMDKTVCILQGNASMTNFTVLKRLPNPHKLLPLRCCHVPGYHESQGVAAPGAGFIASGSEDGNVHVFDLDGFTEQSLKGHTVPVVDVAVTNGSGLLASGDVHGRIILWRRGGIAASGPDGALAT